MSNFEVAHIREQGIDMVIIPLEASFGRRSGGEQNEIINNLQACATSAGLAGKVVPVWDAGGGRMGFIAPQQWHPFFSSLNLRFVAVNLNKTLTCRG